MAKNLLENAGHGSLGNKIFNVLRDKILNEEYVQGQKLNEVALSKELNISRTPIREALKQLELEGLVLMIPRKGARVAAISEKSLKDVLEVRRALEELSVTLACKRIKPSMIKKLRELNEEFHEACRGTDVVKIAQIDESFHQCIYEASENKRLLQLLNQLQNQMYRYRVEYIKNTERRKMLHDEHETLIQRIEEGNVEVAVNCIRQHIIYQEDYVLEVIKQTEL